MGSSVKSIQTYTISFTDATYLSEGDYTCDTEASDSSDITRYPAGVTVYSALATPFYIKVLKHLRGVEGQVQVSLAADAQRHGLPSVQHRPYKQNGT